MKENLKRMTHHQTYPKRMVKENSLNRKEMIKEESCNMILKKRKNRIKTKIQANLLEFFLLSDFLNDT